LEVQVNEQVGDDKLELTTTPSYRRQKSNDSVVRRKKKCFECSIEQKLNS